MTVRHALRYHGDPQTFLCGMKQCGGTEAFPHGFRRCDPGCRQGGCEYLSGTAADLPHEKWLSAKLLHGNDRRQWCILGDKNGKLILQKVLLGEVFVVYDPLDQGEIERILEYRLL